MKKAVLKRRRPFIGRILPYCGSVALLLPVFGIHADQVEMQNGDRYLGKVVSLTNDTLIVQSDYLGTLRLPRAKVASITLGQVPVATAARLAAAPARVPALGSPAVTNSATDLAGAVRNSGVNTNLIQQVQQQFLGDAGPEANAKFNELLSGYLSGKVSVNDIRDQARSAADQLRALKRDGGAEAGWAVDGYLAILDHFLKETDPPAGSATNAPVAPRKEKPVP